MRSILQKMISKEEALLLKYATKLSMRFCVNNKDNKVSDKHYIRVMEEITKTSISFIIVANRAYRHMVFIAVKI